MKNEELFRQKFGKENEYSIYAPYRICTLGAHTDHQLGHINGFAVDKGIKLLFCPGKTENVKIISRNYEGEGNFRVSDSPQKTGNWQDYALAALWALKNSGYTVTYGFEGLIYGELPAGGLSSSAAVIILYLSALCKSNGITLSEKEVIELAHRAEHDFTGLNCGKLDQSCIVLCKKDNLIHIDMKDGSFENIPVPAGMKKFETGLFFSGIEHSLINSDYNKRTEELKSACEAINKAGGKYYGNVLRDIPYEVYKEFESALTDNQKKRCIHFYTENERALKGPELFAKGDIEGYGRLVTQSGESSVINYEAGSPELTALYRILAETPGVYGARFSGAGFKGFCIGLINPDYKEKIANSVREKYTALFPGLKDKYSCTFCSTAPGLGGIK